MILFLHIYAHLKNCLKLGPDGRSVPARLRDLGDGTYKIEWTPATVGEIKFYCLKPVDNHLMTHV